MKLRKTIKRFLYGQFPLTAGRFPYFGVDTYFPPNSLSFHAACDQGIFEHGNVRVLQSFVRPNTTIFDIGANIGLMAIPILKHQGDCKVVSFEPSENVLPYLRRTISESPFRDRWQLIEMAASSKEGSMEFSLSPKGESVYDGLRNTRRASASKSTSVAVTTVDAVWRSIGTPDVSAIKCDVEGADLDVLLGARDCLTATNAAVLIEWNATNLAAYGRQIHELLDFALGAGYRVFALPGFVEVRDELALRLQMIETESFLLAK
jgi:FkbM family methyltransferase